MSIKDDIEAKEYYAKLSSIGAKEHCPRRLMGEYQPKHMPCDTGNFSKDGDKMKTMNLHATYIDDEGDIHNLRGTLEIMGRQLVCLGYKGKFIKVYNDKLVHVAWVKADDWELA